MIGSHASTKIGPDYHHQIGVSLVELMIAMVLGLAMVLAVSRVYLSSATEMSQARAQSELVDKVRLLHERLSYELRRADFWGRVEAGAERQGSIGVSQDCEGAFAFGRKSDSDPQLPLGIWASTSAPDCIPQDHQKAQEYLSIRYASGPVTALEENKDYLKSFYPYVVLFSGDTPPAMPIQADDSQDIWIYGGGLYYLSNEGRGLRRLYLNNGTLKTQEVLTGVDALRYRWGVDDDGDAQPDRYIATEELTTQLVPSLVASRIEMLISVKVRAGYQESKDFTLMDGTVVAPEKGRMYSQFRFTVPLDMHRRSTG